MKSWVKAEEENLITKRMGVLHYLEGRLGVILPLICFWNEKPYFIPIITVLYIMENQIIKNTF
jgi:hypothetical protein